MLRTATKTQTALLLALVAMALAPASQAATTGLIMNSSPGEYVGQGLSYNYAEGEADFAAVTYDDGESVNIAVIGPGFVFWWYLDFGAVPGQKLMAGTYNGCTRYPFNALEAGLAIGGNGRGCNTLTGTFTVHEVNFGTGTEVTSLWVSFTQNCEGSGPLLTGEVMVNAQTVPVETATWGKIKSLYQ